MNNCAPRFLLPLSGSREVTEGESTLLEVRIYGQPQPEVEWSQNGREVIGGKLVQGAQGKYELTITGLGQEHTGEYRCSVVNQFGRVSSAMWLAVVPKTYPANMSTILATPSRKSANSSANSSQSGENKAANFYFSNPLTPQRQPPGTQEFNSGMGERSHSFGCLSYVSRNKPNEIPVNFEKRSTSPRRRAPGFVQRPLTTRLQPGSKLSLSARLLGHPAPKVVWEKDGTPINELTSDRHRITGDDNYHTLEVESVNYTDGGVYRITARNPLGRQQAQATVIVDKEAERSKPREMPKPTMMNKSGNNNVTPPNSTTCEQPPVRRAPRILSRLEDVSVSPGEMVLLNCRVEGGVEAEWSLNGFEVNSIKSDRLHFVTRQFGDNHRLRIVNMDPDLSGEYQLKVSNQDGTVFQSCFVKCASSPKEVLWEEDSSISPYKPELPKTEQQVERQPSFVRGLVDCVCVEGETIMLTAQVAGTPAPTVRFFFEDERFESDPTNGITIQHDQTGVHKLILADAVLDDSGNYSCVAKNEAGHQIESYCKVTVERGAPQIIHVPEQVNASFGEPFSMEIETDGERVKWDYGPEEAIEVAPGRFRLNCTAATKETTQLTVTAITGARQTQASCRLNLTRKRLEPPKFELLLPSEHQVQLNERATFPVEYTGEQCDVKWSFNGAQLSSDFLVESAPWRSTAIISQMKQTLDGELRCQVTNESGSVSTGCAVKYVRKPPTFISTPNHEEIKVDKDEPVKVELDYQGIPLPRATWTKDGQSLEVGITHQRLHTVMELPKASESDQGHYCCRIDNEAGFAQFEFDLTVELPPPPPLQVLPEITSPMMEEKEEIPARILEGLKDKTFAEGEDIVLRCRVEGKPSPTVSWSLGDEPIWSGPPDEGGLSELILKDCWSDDMGIYKIHVANQAGSDESECNVIVQQRLKPLMEPQGPIEPMETILEVSEISSRATSADHSRTTSADSHRTETQARHLDNLSETIESANDLILSSTQIKRPPYFIQPPQAAEIGDGEKDFVWRMTLASATELQVFKMNEDLGSWEETEMDGEFSIVRGPGEGEFEFRFKEVYPDDAGRYKFRATNNDGECEATASLSVIPAEGTPPEFVTKPRSREYTLGAAAIFSCSVAADPVPDIKWELNGCSLDESRTAIHQSTMDDGAIRSELTIRQLEKGDCGRGIVTAQNIHGHVSCQFSILLAPNEEPTPITDFRSQLKNKVQTKALTAEDINSANIQQFDFRSNLKKSRTNENLADLKFDSDHSNELEMDPELASKLANIRNKVDPPTVESEDGGEDSVFVSRETELPEPTTIELLEPESTASDVVPPLGDTYIIPHPSTRSTITSLSDHIEELRINDSEVGQTELSKSHQSINSHASSSSKASTVLNSAREDDIDDNDPGCAPIITKGLDDQRVAINNPYMLEVIADHAEKVTWMLEQEVIIAEPEEGLVITSEGNKYKLLVAFAMAEDQGTYDVIIENRHGKVRSNCFLTVTEKPDPNPYDDSHFL